LFSRRRNNNFQESIKEHLNDALCVKPLISLAFSAIINLTMTKLLDFITIVVFVILLIIVFTAQKPTQKEIINTMSASASQSYEK